MYEVDEYEMKIVKTLKKKNCVKKIHRVEQIDDDDDDDENNYARSTSGVETTKCMEESMSSMSNNLEGSTQSINKDLVAINSSLQQLNIPLLQQLRQQQSLQLHLCNKKSFHRQLNERLTRVSPTEMNPFLESFLRDRYINNNTSSNVNNAFCNNPDNNFIVTNLAANNFDSAAMIHINSFVFNSNNDNALIEENKTNSNISNGFVVIRREKSEQLDNQLSTLSKQASLNEAIPSTETTECNNKVSNILNSSSDITLVSKDTLTPSSNTDLCKLTSNNDVSHNVLVLKGNDGKVEIEEKDLNNKSVSKTLCIQYIDDEDDDRNDGRSEVVEKNKSKNEKLEEKVTARDIMLQSRLECNSHPAYSVASNTKTASVPVTDHSMRQKPTKTNTPICTQQNKNRHHPTKASPKSKHLSSHHPQASAPLPSSPTNKFLANKTPINKTPTSTPRKTSSSATSTPSKNTKIKFTEMAKSAFCMKSNNRLNYSDEDNDVGNEDDDISNEDDDVGNEDDDDDDILATIICNSDVISSSSNESTKKRPNGSRERKDSSRTIVGNEIKSKCNTPNSGSLQHMSRLKKKSFFTGLCGFNDSKKQNSHQNEILEDQPNNKHNTFKCGNNYSSDSSSPPSPIHRSSSSNHPLFEHDNNSQEKSLPYVGKGQFVESGVAYMLHEDVPCCCDNKITLKDNAINIDYNCNNDSNHYFPNHNYFYCYDENDGDSLTGTTLKSSPFRTKQTKALISASLPSSPVHKQLLKQQNKQNKFFNNDKKTLYQHCNRYIL